MLKRIIKLITLKKYRKKFVEGYEKQRQKKSLTELNQICKDIIYQQKNNAEYMNLLIKNIFKKDNVTRK